MGGKEPYWSYQATFEASPISAYQARVFVARHLVDHRLLDLVDPVRLVMSELATNAVVHAQTAFTAILAGFDETVLLTVRDGSLALPRRRAAQVLDPGGRGLEIVDIVSLEWGTDEVGSGSKAVWSSFAIRGPRDF